MNKKAILSTLLVSSALLGTTATHAATSEIKAESKKVTVSTDHAKLYKDSKLKESTTPKNGTVYEVKGYRNIDGKHVYRVYQTNKDGKKVYRGYINRKDTKDFVGKKTEGEYVLNDKANIWDNFYWTKKHTNDAQKVVFAKYEYKLGNGKKYYSVYSKDASGKDVWQGYTSEGNLKAVTSTKESKYVALKKDTKSFANLYFQQTKGNFDVKSGVNFKVTHYYTIDGKKYYSTERAGKTWTGYVDSSVVEDLKAEKVVAADSNVKVAKEWNTYSDHFYTKKAKLADYKGKTLTAKYVYTYGNGKKYVSLYDGETWLGYANVDALDVVTEDKPSKPENPEVKPDKPTDKPDGNKPGTSGDTNKPDTKPDTKPSKPEQPDQPTDMPETKPVVLITKEEVQTFIQEAEELAKDNSGFDNEKEFQQAVKELEQLANSHKNNESVIAAMKKVYQMMIDDLKFVYDQSLPWNDSQEGNNPKLKKMEVLSVVPDKEDVDDLVKQGKDLTKEQFTKFMFDKLPKVEDYYTANSYGPFAKALVEAKELLTEAKTKEVPTAAEAKAIKAAMKSLVSSQQNLRFDRQKMIDLLLDIKKACQKWETEQGKLDAMNLTYLAEVKAHADAADRGANTLAAELGYSLTDEKDHYGEEKEKHQPFSSKEYVDRLLRPNKENAGQLSQLLYLAVNDYYRYISTVKWSAEENKFVAADKN